MGITLSLKVLTKIAIQHSVCDSEITSFNEFAFLKSYGCCHSNRWPKVGHRSLSLCQLSWWSQRMFELVNRVC